MCVCVLLFDCVFARACVGEPVLLESVCLCFFFSRTSVLASVYTFSIFAVDTLGNAGNFFLFVCFACGWVCACAFFALSSRWILPVHAQPRQNQCPLCCFSRCRVGHRTPSPLPSSSHPPFLSPAAPPLTQGGRFSEDALAPILLGLPPRPPPAPLSRKQASRLPTIPLSYLRLRPPPSSLPVVSKPRHHRPSCQYCVSLRRCSCARKCVRVRVLCSLFRVTGSPLLDSSSNPPSSPVPSLLLHPHGCGPKEAQRCPHTSCLGRVRNTKKNKKQRIRSEVVRQLCRIELHVALRYFPLGGNLVSS